MIGNSRPRQASAASNRGGASFGKVRSFTTAPAPTPAAVPAVVPAAAAATEAAPDAQGGCSFTQGTGTQRTGTQRTGGTGRTGSGALLFLLPLGLALLRRRRAA